MALDDTKLDSAFVEVAIRGLAECMSDLRVFKDQLNDAREEMDSLRRAGESTGFDDFRAGVEQSTLAVRKLRGEVAGLADQLAKLPRSITIDIRARVGSALGRMMLPTATGIPTAKSIPTARRLGTAIPIVSPKLPVAQPAYPVARPVGMQRAQVVVPVRVVNWKDFGRGGNNIPSVGRAGGGNALATAGKTAAGYSMAAFAAGSAGIMGFVRAGLQGTVQGEMLTQRIQFLSREIASVFLPVVERLTFGIERLVLWFRGLSGAQQDQILKWSLMTVGAAGFVGMIPRIASGLSGIATTATQIATQFGMSAAAAGPIGIAVAVAAAAAAVLAARFAQLYATSDKFRASVNRIVTVFTMVWDKATMVYNALESFLKPVMAFTSPFLFVLTYMEQIVTLIDKAAAAFVTVWNGATQEVGKMFLRLANIWQDMAAKADNPVLAAGFQKLRGAAIDAAKAANGLKLKVPGDDQKGRRDVTPMQVGNESALDTYNRLQQAAYKQIMEPEKKDEKELLKDLNGHVADIKNAVVKPGPPPVVVAPGQGGG